MGLEIPHYYACYSKFVSTFRVTSFEISFMNYVLIHETTLGLSLIHDCHDDNWIVYFFENLATSYFSFSNELP